MDGRYVDAVREMDPGYLPDRAMLRDFYGCGPGEPLPEVLEHYGVYGAVRDGELVQISTLGVSGEQAVLAYSERREGVEAGLRYDGPLDTEDLDGIDWLDADAEPPVSVYRALNVQRLAEAERRGCASARMSATTRHPKVQGFMAGIGGVATGTDITDDGRVIAFRMEVPLGNARFPTVHGDLAVYDYLDRGLDGRLGRGDAVETVRYDVVPETGRDAVRVERGKEMDANELAEDIAAETVAVPAEDPVYGPAITALGRERAPVRLNHLFDRETAAVVEFAELPAVTDGFAAVPELDAYMAAVGLDVERVDAETVRPRHISRDGRR